MVISTSARDGFVAFCMWCSSLHLEGEWEASGTVHGQDSADCAVLVVTTLVQN